MSDQDTRHFLALLQSADHAMLVTIGPDGSPRARPMAPTQAIDSVHLRFMTRIGSTKLDDIARSTEVAVVVQDGNRYLSVSGQARLTDDPRLLRRLWSEKWREWFPEGPADPDLRLIEIDLVHGRYWDRAGLGRLRYWLASKWAIARGRRPAVPAGTEARIDFRRR